MSILRRINLPGDIHNWNRRRHHLATASAAVLRQETTGWTTAPLFKVESAAEYLFHVTVDLSDSPDLAASHTRPGQYLQLRVPDVARPTFLAITSPPKLASARGAFEFLVKSVAGSTAEALCRLKRGDVVELSRVMGSGFDIGRIDPPEKFQTVLIFATGSGIRIDLKTGNLQVLRLCPYYLNQKIVGLGNLDLYRLLLQERNKFLILCQPVLYFVGGNR